MKRFVQHALLAALISVSAFGGGVEAARVPADAPEISYFGRWDMQNGVRRCGRGATYIKARFTGTSLKASLDDDVSWWRVSIDGGPFRPFHPQGEDTPLAEGLAPGTHQVLLVRSTEGQAGVSTFHGFTVDNGSWLLPPDPPKARRLEFVGDSITAGSSNEGVYDGTNFYDVENGDMAFGPQLARMLNADYSVVAKSGEGVYHNYLGGWPGEEDVHACDDYRWTFYCKKRSPENLVWNPKQFPVDAVVIAIGTNDFSDPDRQPTAEEFTEGYQKLLAVVRDMNPEATIICTEPVPSWIGARPRVWIRKVVDDWTAAGDKKIFFLPLNADGPLLAEKDFSDHRTHPTAKGDTKVANYLKDKVKAILKWK